MPAPRDADAFVGLKVPRGPAFNQPITDGPSWVRRPPLKTADITAMDAAYRRRAQSVLAVDRLLAQTRELVDRLGIRDNTYFVFSSDNGYHMGQHRLAPGKLTAFDTDIHVPLIISGPGVPGGRTDDHVVANIDLAPTFVDLGGGSNGATVDGYSFAPLIGRGDGYLGRSKVLIEHQGSALDAADPDFQGPRGNPPSYAALRDARSIYVEYETGEREYYDLVRDPDQLHNVVASTSPATLGKLHAELLALKACSGAIDCTLH